MRAHTGNQSDMTKLRRLVNKTTIVDKSQDTFAFLGVFQFTQAQPPPSPHKQCWTRVFRMFSEFQHCIRIGWGGGGEGELQENFEKDALFYEGTQN